VGSTLTHDDDAMTLGIIGVGKISEQYFAAFENLPGVRLVAVADLDLDRARTVAEAQGVDALSVDDLIADPRIQAVLNLTIPAAHAEVDLRVLEAGKHVYGEKPLALSPAEAEPILRLAEEKGLRVGSAPDTVLGTGIQTARQVLDAGTIGKPVAAHAFWGAPGHELWHPAPAFYYQPGGGPLFDMGPYYLTALVTLLGPITRVQGAALRSDRVRSAASDPEAREIPVTVDTHVSAVLTHASGAVSTVTVSFDIWATRIPNIEVYGTAGTLSVPDPNHFSGQVQVATSEEREWKDVEPSAGFVDAGRGCGLAEMADAIRRGVPHRASGELAFHVLEVMDAILDPAATGEIRSTVARPEAVPLGQPGRSGD
jgi:predicted dehydrogenase